MDWVLSALVVISNFMIGRKWKWGWIIVMVNCVAWIFYALSLTPPQYGLIPASAINFVVAAVSAYKWFKDDKLNTFGKKLSWKSKSAFGLMSKEKIEEIQRQAARDFWDNHH